MKKLLVLFLLIYVRLQAQDLKTWFVQMPDSIIPTLTAVNRADCIDFLESNMQAKVTNRFDTQSEMTILKSGYIALQLTPNSHIQLKALPTDTTNIICLIKTVCSEACDSRVRFFDTTWKELDSKQFLVFPQASDFLPDTISANIADTISPRWEELRAQADILLMQITAHDSLPEIKIEYTTPDYMNKEAAAKLIPLLKQKTIIYEWKNGKFCRKRESETH